MKDFTANQKALHMQATAILTELQVWTELEADEKKKANPIQKNIDFATARKTEITVKYYEVLKQITEPIITKMMQTENVRPLTNMEIAEAYFNKD